MYPHPNCANVVAHIDPMNSCVQYDMLRDKVDFCKSQKYLESAT